MTKCQNREVSAPLRVRIGLTTRNRPEYLTKCLSSCLAQTYEPKEIVVWDDSDDPEVLKATEEIKRQFPQVRWIHPTFRTTCNQARVQLMSKPGCDIFCSIDDDGWFMGNDELVRGVREIERAPDCAGIAYDILSPDRPNPVSHSSPQPTMTFIGCGFMLRGWMLKEAGYYAEFPGWYGAEEKDLCIRFMDRGWTMSFLPGVHVWHDKTTKNRNWAELHRSGTLNDMIFGLLRTPFPDVLYYLPGKAVNLVAWGLKGTKRERWSGMLGLWDFARHAPEYWKKRQPVSRKTFREFFRSGRQCADKPRDWDGKER
jgi:GT2 family glycosyltransferase